METSIGSTRGGTSATLESSYEEWKRGCIRKNVPRFGTLESSYEEWKQQLLARGTLRRADLLNLPMRNGNRSATSFRAAFGTLLNLPMRNGNNLRGRCRAHFPRTLESSYEEWKPTLRGSSSMIMQPLESSYEEWKLWLAFGNPTRNTLLNLPMRNGNLYRPTRSGVSSFPS